MPNTPQSELTAILHGAAIAPITDRAFLRITGPDATRWLNGMVTNSVQSLAPGEGNYNFLLNAQGRIQGDCTLYREPGEGDPAFLLETHKSQLETIHPLLDKFIIMDDVELAPTRSDEAGLLLLGPQAPAALESLGLPTPGPNRLVAAPTPHGPVTILTTQLPNRFALFANTASLHALLQQLTLPEASPQILEAFRILSGTPRYGTDIRNTETARDLPQETAQTHALHFTKGCYLGQEIVERIHSRGQVHRTFTRFRLTPADPAAALPTLPVTLQADGRPAGELTSAAWVPIPDGPQLLALGYIRREALELRKELTYPGGIATAQPASE